ncbi:MAG TPA: hypothetical protein VEO73_00610 [Gemmatimonadales bacterium]|nr:hypothetical protein [Gemmatimonadales bacterium]
MRQGEIADRQHRRANAIAGYTGFLALWQGVDPELRSSVVMAEQALARLRPLTDSATRR